MTTTTRNPTVTIVKCATGQTFIASSDDPDYWAVLDDGAPDALPEQLTAAQIEWIRDGNIIRSFWQPRALVEQRGIVEERVYEAA